MIGYDATTGVEAFDCRFAFCFDGRKESRIKNFSIHDPAQRGQGIGAKTVANLLDVTRSHGELEQISLTAELERGAMVWLKMGWLPEQTSFTKLQKKCLAKLDTLQQLLPKDERLSPMTYGIFRDILDHQSTSDPSYAWAIVDSGAAYTLKAMRDMQDLANIPDQAERHAAIKARAQANGIAYSDADASKADKNLVFIRQLDLDNLAREGRVKVAATILAWESWKGNLRLDNPAQVARLESALGRTVKDPTQEMKAGHAKPEGLMHRDINA